jgi:ADP-ribose pyrophosphatase YjhB (NUDIX family)
VETRAVIFNEEEKILLVRDFDGRWNPPGGWCEHNLSIYDNTIKEVREETGLTSEPYRLAAVFDHRKSNNGVRILWAISWVSTLDPKSLRVNDHAKTK